MIELVQGTERWQPGTWWPVRLEGGRQSAFVTCPLCRLGAALEDHEIDADGAVSPSLVCPREGCSWHVWVKLKDWKP